MAKITRATQLIFASTATTAQIAKFGSLAAAAPVTYSGSTVTPTLVQSLSNYLSGWFGAVVGANSPAIEDMNAIHYLITYQLAYLLQTGVPEWDSATTYFQGSVVTAIDGSGTMYVSLTNTNLNNALSVSASWKVISLNALTTLGDTLYSLANGVPARLAGNITTTPQILTQTGTGSASAAPVWRNFLSRTFTIITTGTAATYTPPAGVLYLLVKCWGAGGGGAGCPITTSTQSSIGGGGASGAYGEKLIANPTGTYLYTVGAAGAGGVGGASGSPGTSTTFSGTGATLVASNGTGGNFMAVTTVPAIAGGGNGVAATGFDFSLSGIQGGNGVAFVAGASGFGAAGLGGPPPILGFGQFMLQYFVGTSTNAVPSGNTVYASGGKGSNNSGVQATAVNGSAGGPGLILIEEYYQ